jgi:two-component system chemotaxis response regulator CheY
MKVLICDDAGFLREILTQLVSEFGYHVVGEARDGVEVVEKAVKLSPDLVLLDLVLPLKNGSEAARDIREKLPNVKIAALSTVDEAFLKRKSEEAGFDGYLVKPFSKEDLKTLLRNMSQPIREVGNG